MTVADRIIPGHHDIAFESGQICHTSFSALSGRLDEDGGLGHLCAPTRIQHSVTALVKGPVRRFQRADFRSQNTPQNIVVAVIPKPVVGRCIDIAISVVPRRSCIFFAVMNKKRRGKPHTRKHRALKVVLHRARPVQTMVAGLMMLALIRVCLPPEFGSTYRSMPTDMYSTPSMEMLPPLFQLRPSLATGAF